MIRWSARRTCIALGVVVVVLIGAASVHWLWSRADTSRQSAPAVAGLPDTPPLGWNSWNAYGCDVDEAKIRKAVDVMAGSGMREAGYRYVVIDDCWFAPERGASGELRAEPSRFPGGMRALADYAHSRGLKFGLYAGASFETCAQLSGVYPGRTGSRGHELTDARTFADWGVDFLKYDWCGPAAGLPETIAVFTTMRDALRATGRPIVYSINPNSNGIAVRLSWLGRFAGVATMTRVSQDVIPMWHVLGGGGALMTGLRDTIDSAITGNSTCATTRGYFCDYDMLTIASTSIAGVATAGLTEAEERTQLAMWAMWAAPLFAGNDLGAMSAQTSALLTNRAVVDIDQDPLVRPATVLPGSDGSLWARPLADGSTAIAMVNREDVPRLFFVVPPAFGLPFAQGYDLLDVFTGVRTAEHGFIRVEVPPHDTALLRARAAS